MRFSAILVTLGLTGALATPTLTSRQNAPAAGVISGIQAQLSAVASAVSAFDGKDPKPVEDASSKLVTIINDGTKTVSSGPAMTTMDALGLTGPVQDLTKQTEGVINDLISKKDQFVAANAGPTVYQNLQEQYTASDNLSKAISAKVPQGLGDLASQLAAGITAAIQKGIDAYKDAGSAPTSSGTSSASATETSTKTETSTGTATATATVTGTTTSTPVIPTGTASTTPSGSASPSKTSSGSTSTSTNLLATGAASKEHFSYSLGGAVVAAAIAVAF
jgi:hypothetical protein